MFDRLRYDYKGYFNCDGYCYLSIHEGREKTVVIATEAPGNPGTSITNVAEHLATQVCRDFEIDPQSLVWIEHYPDRHPPGMRRDRTFDETFDRVTFDWDGSRFKHPKWRPISRQEVEALIEEMR